MVLCDVFLCFAFLLICILYDLQMVVCNMCFSGTGLNLMGYVRLVFFSDWSEFDGLCASCVFQ